MYKMHLRLTHKPAQINIAPLQSNQHFKRETVRLPKRHGPGDSLNSTKENKFLTDVGTFILGNMDREIWGKGGGLEINPICKRDV